MFANFIKSNRNRAAKCLSVTLAASITAVLALSIISATSSEANAKRYKRGHHNTIRIESRFSPNKYIYAPVRTNYHGDREVRLPTGLWVNCAQNCRWTVQKEYLDFWEYQQNPFGPGYIRFNRSFD